MRRAPSWISEPRTTSAENSTARLGASENLSAVLVLSDFGVVLSSPSFWRTRSAGSASNLSNSASFGIWRLWFMAAGLLVTISREYVEDHGERSMYAGKFSSVVSLTE